MSQASATAHRRVVTGHRDGKSVVLGDTMLSPYKFRSVPGFAQTYVWATYDGGEAGPAPVDARMPESALPTPGGSIVQIVTFPPASRRDAAGPAAIAHEYQARLPGLAESFEHDGSRMHVTPTIDYAVMLDGELSLELDDGETVRLCAGDIVVQQKTRHGWRNTSERPATILFIMLGADR